MLKYFKPKIRSRHPSHNILRKIGTLPLFPFKSVIRLGSYTKIDDSISSGGNRIELNTVDSIKNSADKLRMKQCFSLNNVITAEWWCINNNDKGKQFIFQNEDDGNKNCDINELPYPIIAKHRLGSKGTGNYKLNSKQELTKWLKSRTTRLGEYIFEKFYNFAREYRLHITEEGCFYTCRKVLKKDTPENAKWYRNDEHCNWIMIVNPLFDKPKVWDIIIENSIKALISTGLDFGAVDVKVQSATDNNGKIRIKEEFIIIEINSAPSFGKITEKKYLEMIPKLLIKKKFKINIKDEEQKEINITC